MRLTESTSGVILCDMDGVLADTMGHATKIIHEEHGIEIPTSEIHDYWFKGLSVEPSVFVEILRRKGFYRELDVMPGAVEAVGRLRANHDVRILSAPMSGCERSCEFEKRDWLEEHFDTDFARQAIITSEKHKVDGLVLVEDNPDITRDASWVPIMFDQAWNRHVTDLPRIMSWEDVSG